MKTLIISAVLAAATVGCLCLRDLTNPTNQQFSEIELANIEALATTEPNNQCPGMCQEWNDKGGGGIACDCGRHEGKCTKYCPMY